MKGATSKQKLKWLGIAFLPLLFLCYKLALARTVSEYALYRANKEAISQLDTSTGEGISMEARRRQLDGLSALYFLDTSRYTSNLLEIVTEFCHDNNLKLKDYRPLGMPAVQPVRVLTRIVTVSGEFLPCLRLVYALEMQFRAGKVRSVAYQSFTDPATKEPALDCTIYIQNILADEK